MRKTSYSLNLTHLYPKDMNIYGDIGNVICLIKRCEWRGIKINLNNVNLKDNLPQKTDIYFMSGGQDKDQYLIYKDFFNKRKKIADDIDDEAVFLAVCGAYQLLGKEFVTGDGKVLEGIGILEIITKAPNSNLKSRCVGNVAAKLNPKIFGQINMPLNTIVGFENHSGQTYLGSNMEPLANVIKGFGNNSKEKIEGCVFKGVIGTYLHGSFLPKNPHIADYLIQSALKRKYKKIIPLSMLNDSAEYEAHKNILKKLSIE